MYLNASILQEIYQSWLDNMVWCLYLFHDYFILSCNIQLLFVTHPRSALWSLENESTDTS